MNLMMQLTQGKSLQDAKNDTIFLLFFLNFWFHVSLSNFLSFFTEGVRDMKISDLPLRDNNGEGSDQLQLVEYLRVPTT